MKLTTNDIFKLISLRGPATGLTIDPAADVPDSEVQDRLENLAVDWRTPSSPVLQALADLTVLSNDDVAASPLEEIAEVLDTPDVLTFKDLAVLTAAWGGGQLPLADIAVTSAFTDAYSAVTDSWLLLVLRKTGEAVKERHERTIRAAHLALRLANQAPELKDPDVIAKLRRARVVVPRRWPRAYHKQSVARVQRAAQLDAQNPPAASVREAAIQEAKARFQQLAGRIRARESLQQKVHGLYGRLKGRALQPPIKTEGVAGALVRSTIVNGVAEAVFAPPPVELTRTGISASLLLDGAFYDSLREPLTDAEKAELDATLLPLPKRPDALTDLLGVLDLDTLVAQANDACSQIHVWEAEQAEALPPADQPPTTSERPSVRAIGWGDLIVARERLIGYDAREIAHIECILSGEKKVREHERNHKIEELTETETIQESESERDLQTSDRYELQSQSESTINNDFSVEAGVNTSGRYGLTQIDTSLEAGFSQSSSEAQSSSVRLAKDIVSRTVERTFESVRKLRRTMITEQIRELNIHTIDNTPGPSVTTMPPSRSGVYLWVEKLHEVELRHYGTRMMLELHVPEPAVSLLERDRPKPLPVKKPAPFAIGPADVTAANYLCLTKTYGATDVKPPPMPFVQVGWAWASRPSESDEEGTSEDTVADLVKVPEHYAPIAGRAVVSAHPGHAQYVDVFVAVAGHPVINVAGTSFGQVDYDFDPQDTWPQGVPVSIRAYGHFDKTLTAQITLRCQRTPEAFREWQLRTYESLRQAHQVLVREHERAVERAAAEQRTGLVRFMSLPGEALRSLEREELKKWSIKAMRCPHQFQFNAVELVGDYQEASVLGADFQAPIVRFFEEAFEWRQISYFTYPYFWSRRDTWKLRHGIDHPDPLHRAFLRAGAARIIVPVTPGYEARVLRYLEANEENEHERIAASAVDEAPAGSEAEDLWMELLIHKHEEQALGSGTLSVQPGQVRVTINPDSNWRAAPRDVGREIFIGAKRYQIAAVAAEDQLDLNEPYAGAADTRARYTTGSVSFGPPWTVRIPTGLVILDEDRARLAGIGG